jgi:hypothetical protein
MASGVASDTLASSSHAVADIFISHDRDDRATAERLARALEVHGWSVWLDAHITTGERWDDAIERELAAAQAVVVLWSRQSVASTWVRNEARRGLQRRRLVPAIIDPEGVTIPVEFDGEQTADLADWDGEPLHPGLAALTAGVARLVAAAPDAVQQAARRPPSPDSTNRRIVLWGLAILGLSVVAYVAFPANPHVLLLQSALPETTYDDDAAAAGQTNAVSIANALRDLPVSVTSESVAPGWHREDEIRRLDPSLVIIDSSAFYSRSTGSDHADRLLGVLEALQDTRIRFLIYTRASPAEFERAVRERIPVLATRVAVWQVPGGANASFAHAETQRALRELVTRMLQM